MKWIGQHIWSFISRFRDDVYLEDLTTDTSTSVLVVDSNDKVCKNTSFTTADPDLDVTSDSGTIDIDLDSETLDIEGGSDIETTATGVTVTVNHSAVARSDTASSASPAHNGTFTCYDSITTGANGHVTAANLRTVTLPADLAGRTTFYAAADSGSNNLISDGNTLAIKGGTNCATVASATDIITINATDTNTWRPVTVQGYPSLGASESLSFIPGAGINIGESGGAVTIVNTGVLNYGDESFTFFTENLAFPGTEQGTIMKSTVGKANKMDTTITMNAVQVLKAIKGTIKACPNTRFLSDGKLVLSGDDGMGGKLRIYKFNICTAEIEEGAFDLTDGTYLMGEFAFTLEGPTVPTCVDMSLADEEIRALTTNDIVIPVLQDMSGDGDHLTLQAICTLEYDSS